MEQTQQVSAAIKPFVCHGVVPARATRAAEQSSHDGKPCTAKLTQAEAWVPTLQAIHKMVGRWPSMAKDLAGHIHCGRCAALGRKAGLRFYRYPQTVVEMERRRVERTTAARQAFRRYL